MGTIAGRCLCGGVRLRVDGELRDVVNCHCHRCRRWSGHHVATTAADVDAVTVEDDDGTLTWYAVPGAEYGSCSRCGSSLFWRAEATPGRLSICAGVLDPPTGLQTREAWGTDEASDYVVRPELPEHRTE